MCVLVCRFKSPEVVNALLQLSHEYAFSFKCIRMCFWRSPFSRNVLSQTVQEYGLAPEWVRMCTVRWCASLNNFLQIKHSRVFTGLWESLCLERLLAVWKCLSQRSHLNALSCPVWTFICLLRLLDTVKVLSHATQLYGLSPLWIRMCDVRCAGCENRFPHFTQTWRLTFACSSMCRQKSPVFAKDFLHTGHALLFESWTNAVCCVVVSPFVGIKLIMV